MRWLIVGAGGFLGAIARYALGGWIHAAYGGTFPLGTLCINALGCLAAGCAMGWIDHSQALSANARLFWLIGILGAFTTFSTFGFETIELVREGELARALASVGLNLVLGLGAVVAGRALILLAVR